MRRFDVTRTGISGLIAQVDSPMVLDAWFESKDERSYVVKFSDYCAYMATYNREGYSNIPFSRAHKIIEKLLSNELKMRKNDVNEVITGCYNLLTHDVGVLLLKEVGLYSRSDCDWTQFNIEISLPIVLRDYFGIKQSADIASCVGMQEFIEVVPTMSFEDACNSPQILDIIVKRTDVSMRDIAIVKNTDLERLVIMAASYLLMSSKNIKGRIRVR